MPAFGPPAAAEINATSETGYVSKLREMNLGCLVHLKREGWQAVNRMPQFSCQGLDQVHQDGLLSPGRSHIERLKRILRDIRDSQEAMVPTMEKSIFSQPTDAEKARLQDAFEVLEADSEAYLRALGKMDNAGLGGYWTYLRYRFIPARGYVN